MMPNFTSACSTNWMPKVSRMNPKIFWSTSRTDFVRYCATYVESSISPKSMLRMMKEPVKQRGRKDLIAQEAAPVGKAGIRGQPDRAVFVASGHQLKEMVGLGRRQVGVAYLVDHQHTGGGVAAQPLAHQTRIRGALQGLSQ